MYAEIKIHLNEEDIKNCIRDKFKISDTANVELETVTAKGISSVHASFSRKDAEAKIIFEEASN